MYPTLTRMAGPTNARHCSQKPARWCGTSTELCMPSSESEPGWVVSSGIGVYAQGYNGGAARRQVWPRSDQFARPNVISAGPAATGATESRHITAFRGERKPAALG